MRFTALELLIILVIVVLLFGVGRLPEVGSAVGKGIREFRSATQNDDEQEGTNVAASSSAGNAVVGGGAASLNMVFCGECGGRNIREAKFCTHCGESMRRPDT